MKEVVSADRRKCLSAILTASTLALAGCTEGTGDDSEENNGSDEEDGEEKEEESGLELRNVDAEVRNGTLARPVVFGELKNHTDDELELVEVVVRLYDDQGNRIERKAVRTRELRAGAVWSWEAEFFDTDPERVGSYDAEADVM